MSFRGRPFLFPILVAIAIVQPVVAQSYKYFRLGNATDVSTQPVAGYALMGGGKDLDAAFKWLCEHASGGDFLVLRSSGDDDYNPYVQGLCKANSVSTLILPDKASAEDPRVPPIIRQAEAIFIAGGDQAKYINHWTNTPVQVELNAAIRRGVPLGGTSAGLAVMAEFVYSAQGDAPDDPDLTSALALSNPFHPRVTVRRNFLEIPILKNILTDTHFRKRDRMGRSLVFSFAHCAGRLVYQPARDCGRGESRGPARSERSRNRCRIRTGLLPAGNQAACHLPAKRTSHLPEHRCSPSAAGRSLRCREMVRPRCQAIFALRGKRGRALDRSGGSRLLTHFSTTSVNSIEKDFFKWKKLH
jgi:cyanophycinase-like exopeptidase